MFSGCVHMLFTGTPFIVRLRVLNRVVLLPVGFDCFKLFLEAPARALRLSKSFRC